MTPLEPDRICVKRYSIAKEVQTMRPQACKQAKFLTSFENRTLKLLVAPHRQFRVKGN